MKKLKYSAFFIGVISFIWLFTINWKMSIAVFFMIYANNLALQYILNK